MCSTYLLLQDSINVMTLVCLSACFLLPFALARVHSVLAGPSRTFFRLEVLMCSRVGTTSLPCLLSDLDVCINSYKTQCFSVSK